MAIARWSNCRGMLRVPCSCTVEYPQRTLTAMQTCSSHGGTTLFETYVALGKSGWVLWERIIYINLSWIQYVTLHHRPLVKSTSISWIKYHVICNIKMWQKIFIENINIWVSYLPPTYVVNLLFPFVFNKVKWY